MCPPKNHHPSCLEGHPGQTHIVHKSSFVLLILTPNLVNTENHVTELLIYLPIRYNIYIVLAIMDLPSGC